MIRLVKLIIVFMSISFVFCTTYTNAENNAHKGIINVHDSNHKHTQNNPNLKLPSDAPYDFYNPASNEEWRISNATHLNHRFWKFEIMDIVDFYLTDVDFVIDHPRKVLMISDDFNAVRDGASRIVGLLQAEPKKIGSRRVIENVKFCAYDESYLNNEQENGTHWVILITKSTGECLLFLKERYDATSELHAKEHARYQKMIRLRKNEEVEKAKAEMAKFEKLLERIKRIKNYNETRRKSDDLAKSYFEKLVEAKKRSDKKYGNNQ